ncbi:MAG: VWA domain-containing protein [Phycisphaerae bacterium]|jgi:Ca-activated chloride channel family protein|nr:VWA domain-containing protein [Phycisphaerae bacterium]
MPFTFEQPLSLHWLWPVALAAIVLWWAFGAQRRAMRLWADADLFVRLAPAASAIRFLARGVLALLACSALVVALLDPRMGDTPTEVQRRGIDVVFVIDVSRSMLAQDVAPNRLEQAKQMISDAVDRMAGDRAGLIAFAGTPVLKSPLTLNYGAFKLALNELTPQDSARGGSLLGDAIRVATEAFTDQIKGGKAIIVVSDGEDMESFPVEAAKRAFDDHGVRTYAVGIGDSVDGARIPVMAGRERTWLVHEGKEVWTKMDPKLLTDMCLAGGGAFVPAGTRLVDMGEVYESTVAAVGRREFETTTVKRTLPQFQWFAGLAALLLVVESLVGWRSARTSRGDAIPQGDPA